MVTRVKTLEYFLLKNAEVLKLLLKKLLSVAQTPLHEINLFSLSMLAQTFRKSVSRSKTNPLLMRDEDMPAPNDGRHSQSQVHAQSTASFRYGCAFTVNIKAQYWKVAVGNAAEGVGVPCPQSLGFAHKHRRMK